MIFDRNLIEMGKNNEDIKCKNKSFLIKLLSDLCTISEHKDFEEDKTIDDNIDYIIEFDVCHDNLLAKYPQERLRELILFNAMHLYRIILCHYNKDVFTFMNGQEILQQKEELKKIIEKEELHEKQIKEAAEYSRFKREMNKFWADFDIERQLIQKDAAFVYGPLHTRKTNAQGITTDVFIHDGIEQSNPYTPINKKYLYKNISKRDPANEDFFKGIHYFPKYEIDNLTLLKNFDIINIELLDKFMQENNFDWELGMRVEEIVYETYPTIVGLLFFGLIDRIFGLMKIKKYTYVLKISCKN